ncbi:MAG: hypothetical protein J6L69_10390 [Lachnospiraceae bacterium]|nr:hypothetical protein [Lachnospiraceae bacterium]
MKELIMETLVTIGSAGLVAIIGCAGRWICSKIATEKQKAIVTKNTALQSAFTAAEIIISTTVDTVVGKIEQVKAADLRQLVKNGTKDRAELVALSKEAYDEIVATLGPMVFEEMSGVIVDSEKYILSKIEDAVRKVKLQTGGGGSDE